MVGNRYKHMVLAWQTRHPLQTAVNPRCWERRQTSPVAALNVTAIPKDNSAFTSGVPPRQSTSGKKESHQKIPLRI
jgi:hypothetical protein